MEEKLFKGTVILYEGKKYKITKIHEFKEDTFGQGKYLYYLDDEKTSIYSQMSKFEVISYPIVDYKHLKGKFITFEGGEGGGKSTQIKNLKEELERDTDITVDLFREPGSTSVSEDIRSVIMNHKDMCSYTQAYLMAGARAQLVNEKIIPALKAGHIVLCDRFVHSSLVYQGYVEGLSLELVWSLNRLFALQGYYPDYIFCFDLDPKIGLNRIKTNNRTINKFDELDIAFHEKVRTGYLKLDNNSSPGSKNLHMIDASKTQTEVFDEIIKIIQ